MKYNIFYANFFGILICSLILLGAFYFQFEYNENPCSLCILQRCCFLGVMFGFFLNLKYEYCASHYSLSIISSLLGLTISARQILLHICPSFHAKGYGPSFLGMHLYTWSFIIFFIIIFSISVLLFFKIQFDKKYQNNCNKIKNRDYFIKLSLFLCIAFSISNIITIYI